MARMRAGGWFSLCLAAANAALMLLWFWGGSRKRKFFDRLAVPLDSFLLLGDAADAQMSLTVAQQRVAVHGSGLHIKRARGAPPETQALRALCGNERRVRAAAVRCCTCSGLTAPSKQRMHKGPCVHKRHATEAGGRAGVGIYYSNDIHGVPPVMLQSVRGCAHEAGPDSRLRQCACLPASPVVS